MQEIKKMIIVTGQEKPHYVHLAPEYEYRAKNLMKVHKNEFKTCSMALNALGTFAN